MKIHEITKAPKNTQQVDEGLLDGVKAAVTAAKTGYKKGGIGGLLSNLTSNTALAQGYRDIQRQETEKRLQKLEKKWGTKLKRPMSWYVDQVVNDPEKKSERQDIEAGAVNAFPIGKNYALGVLPDPGKVLKVILNNGEYYKDTRGKWYNSEGTPITGSSASLEGLIDSDQYSQVGIPPVMSGGNAPAKQTKQVQPTQQVKPTQPAAAPANVEQTTEGVIPKANLQRNAGVRTPVQQVNKNLASQQQEKPASVRGKKSLRKDFERWLVSVMPEYQSLSNTIKQSLSRMFNQFVKSKDVKDLDNFLINVQAAALQSEGFANDEETQPGQSSGLERFRNMSPEQRMRDPEWRELMSHTGTQTQEAKLAEELEKYLKINNLQG